MSDWQAIPSNKRKCNYSAYELVTCQIRAHNNNNNMNSETATTDSIYTKCTSKNFTVYLHCCVVNKMFFYGFPMTVGNDNDSCYGVKKKLPPTFSCV